MTPLTAHLLICAAAATVTAAAVYAIHRFNRRGLR